MRVSCSFVDVCHNIYLLITVHPSSLGFVKSNLFCLELILSCLLQGITQYHSVGHGDFAYKVGLNYTSIGYGVKNIIMIGHGGILLVLVA